MINKINYYFSLIMIALYFIIGLLFLFSDIVIDTFPAYREVIGGILLLYGVFRLYSIVKRRNRRNDAA